MNTAVPMLSKCRASVRLVYEKYAETNHERADEPLGGKALIEQDRRKERREDVGKAQNRKRPAEIRLRENADPDERTEKIDDETADDERTT